MPPKCYLLTISNTALTVSIKSLFHTWEIFRQHKYKYRFASLVWSVVLRFKISDYSRDVSRHTVCHPYAIVFRVWTESPNTEAFSNGAFWMWTWSHLPVSSETRRRAETEGGPLGRPPVLTVHLLRLELIKGDRWDFLGCPAWRLHFSSVSGLSASEGKIKNRVHSCNLAAERDSVPCLRELQQG